MALAAKTQPPLLGRSPLTMPHVCDALPRSDLEMHNGIHACTMKISPPKVDPISSLSNDPHFQRRPRWRGSIRRARVFRVVPRGSCRVPLFCAIALDPHSPLQGGGEDTIFPHRENHGAQWPRGPSRPQSTGPRMPQGTHAPRGPSQCVAW